MLRRRKNSHNTLAHKKNFGKFNFFLFSSIALTFFSFFVSTQSAFSFNSSSSKILGASTENVKEDIQTQPEIQITPTVIPTSTPIIVQAKTVKTIRKLVIQKPTISTPQDPKYTAEKIGTTTYRISDITSDTQMGQAHEIFDALNEYRRANGKTTLSWDDKLSSFAQDRANNFDSIDNLDSHKGFIDFVNNGGFEKLGFNGLGENSAILSVDMRADRIIKEIFGADSEHDSNQLQASWQYAGVGVKDKSINIIFGRNKR